MGLSQPVSLPVSPPSSDVDFGRIDKLPASWRYTNISVFWIFYYRSIVRVLYRLNVRHEVVTACSVASGLAGAWAMAIADSLSMYLVATVLVHLKDLFDACDGALARLTGTGHAIGRFLDTIGDAVVFTAWIGVVAWRYVPQAGALVACTWAVAAWVSLFLQCSYFNFYQLHYIEESGALSESRLDERTRHTGISFLRGLTLVYELWFGWQDRLVSWFDRRQRRITGRAATGWYSDRLFMTANSVLCFGTHAFVLMVCLVAGHPEWFLPTVVVGLNLYLVGILLARRIIYRRP